MDDLGIKDSLNYLLEIFIYNWKKIFILFIYPAVIITYNKMVYSFSFIYYF